MKTTDPHPDHDHCMELFQYLSEYIDRELDATTRMKIEAHIQSCKPCQVCLRTLKQTVNLCNHLERHQVPASFSHKLKAAIDKFVKQRPPL